MHLEIYNLKLKRVNQKFHKKKILFRVPHLWCQEKISTEKSPPRGVRGRARVRSEIKLGLVSGRLFSGEIFS